MGGGGGSTYKGILPPGCHDSLREKVRRGYIDNKTACTYKLSSPIVFVSPLDSVRCEDSSF